jgi:hypothetical protein
MFGAAMISPAHRGSRPAPSRVGCRSTPQLKIGLNALQGNRSSSYASKIGAPSCQRQARIRRIWFV